MYGGELRLDEPAQRAGERRFLVVVARMRPPCAPPTAPRRRRGACRPARPPACARPLRGPRRVEERRFDLAELDPVAAELDLMIRCGRGTRARRRHGSGRDRPVRYSRPPWPANGSGTKRSAVSSGRLAIAAGQAGAADEQLSHRADRHRLERARRARRRGCCAIGRPIAGASVAPARHRRHRRVRGALGRTVDVEHALDAAVLVHLLREPGLERLAAEADDPDRRRQRAGAHQFRHRRRHAC